MKSRIISLITFIFLATKTLARDHEITNEDSSLDVAIDPPIRLNMFETSPFISEQTVIDIINATSTFVTKKLGEYFRREHGDTYLFDRVNLEATYVESIVRGGRRLRSFEREEDNVRSALRRDNGIEGSGIRSIIMGDERDMQEEEYGTSIILGGNVTFAFLPAAPSDECNQIFQETMKRYWGLHQFIKRQKNAELAKVTMLGLSTELVTPEPTVSPTDSPTSSPTKQPTSSPTKQPTSSPTASPTRGPTKTPTDIPSNSPSYTPTISRNPTWTDYPSLTPSISLHPSIQPSSPTLLENGIITDREKPVDESILPVIIPIIIAFVLVAIGGLFFLKHRRDKQTEPQLLRHDKLGDEDYDMNPRQKLFDGRDDLVGMASTKDDSLDSGNDSGGDENGQRGLSFENSFASGSTLKTTNVFSNENSWMQNRSLVGSFDATSMLPKSSTADIESQQNTSDSVSTLTYGDIGSVSQGNSGILPTAPGLRSYFGDEEMKTSSSSLRVHPASSPNVNVTPSKVSKEEFGKDWDIDLPFNWKPNPDQSSDQKPSASNRSSDEFDGDGSFPTFTMVNDPPAPTRPNNMESSYATSSRSNGDSSFYTSSGLHSQDWSNKGSEHDGASISGSTLTEGDGQMASNEKPIVWNGTSPNKSGLTDGGAYLTPMSQLTRHTNAPFTATSGITPRSMNAGSIGSSPSSRGSGKQLINDLVWLEKKIADVRARVDRLDGDESQTTGSPPTTPSTVDHKTAGSPITENCGIVCRDIIAPPGKLQITIHSTKDGPAIHSVKQGSVLEGHLFTGDLIVAVDDTDTRSWSAEDVMGIMSQNSSKERKLTVLHAS